MSGMLHVLWVLYQWITVQRRDIVASDKICPAHATASTHAHWQPSLYDLVMKYVIFMCLPFCVDKICSSFSQSWKGNNVQCGKEPSCTGYMEHGGGGRRWRWCIWPPILAALLPTHPQQTNPLYCQILFKKKFSVFQLKNNSNNLTTATHLRF